MTRLEPYCCAYFHQECFTCQRRIDYNHTAFRLRHDSQHFQVLCYECGVGIMLHFHTITVADLAQIPPTGWPKARHLPPDPTAIAARRRPAPQV